MTLKSRSLLPQPGLATRVALPVSLCMGAGLLGSAWYVAAEPSRLAGPDLFVAAGVNYLLLRALLRRPEQAIREAAAFAVTLEQPHGQSLDLDCSLPEIHALGSALNEASTRLAGQQRALADANDFLGRLADTMGEGMYALDGAGRCTFLNREASRLLGWKAEELLGKNLHDAIHYLNSDGSPLPREECLVHHSISYGETMRSREEILVTKDGRMLPVSIVAAPLFRNKRVEGSVAVFQDISRTKQDETELWNAKELAETANRAKSEFLRAISLEIRAPLNAIVDAAERVKGTALDEVQSHHVATLGAAADVLVSMADDIFDVARMEAGQFDLESNEFSLSRTVGEVMQILAPRAARKGLDFTWTISPALLIDRLVGDSGRLRQVVHSLVENAIIFTERGKISLGVSAERTTIGNVCLRFDVKDTGIGIPSEKQEEIFDLFTRLESPAQHLHHGTGLGLAIAKRLVEIMGGHLWVTSQVGIGSEFHFTACFNRTAVPGTRTEAVEELAGLAVLIASENPTNCHILEQILLSWGMRPVLAEGPSQILDGLAQIDGGGAKPLSLVMVDANWLEGENPEAAMLRAALRKPGTPPAIALVAAGDRAAAAHCRELGVAGCVAKPLAKAELLRTLRAVLADFTRCASVAPPPLIADPTARRLDILLVDDNPLGREVTFNILQRRGHRVSLAENGQQAVKACAAGKFDLILMDIEMPQMDGLQATRIIRAAEVEGGQYTPIVALSGHAAETQKKRYQEAGMDGFLSKPVQIDALLDTIDRVTNLPETPPPVAAADSGSGRRVDIPALLEQVDGEYALAGKLAGMYRSDLPNHLQAIAAALQDGDAAQLTLAAHAIKGLIGVFGKGRAFEAARTLEMRARAGDLENAQAVLDELESEARLVEQELAELAEQWRNEGV